MFLPWTGEVLQQGVQTPTRDSHQPGPSQKREHIARPCLRLRRGFVSTLLSLRCACSSCRSTRRVIFVEFSWDRVSVNSRRMSSHGNRGCISLSKKSMSWRCKKGTTLSLYEYSYTMRALTFSPRLHCCFVRVHVAQKAQEELCLYHTSYLVPVSGTKGIYQTQQRPHCRIYRMDRIIISQFRLLLRS